MFGTSVGAELFEGLGLAGRLGKGILGMAGIMTADGFDLCDGFEGPVGCDREGAGAVAEEGVVGCVESASEGAREVAGVSRFALTSDGSTAKDEELSGTET